MRKQNFIIYLFRPFLGEIVFFSFYYQYVFVSWMSTWLIAKNRIYADNRVVRATQIPSQVRGLNRLHYSALRVNPITFFDSRLLAGTHTRLPSDRTIESDSRRSWRHEGRMFVRSFDLEKQIRNVIADCRRLLRFVHATTETYETITKNDFTPRGDQLHARGPKKCRGLVSARQCFVTAKSLLVLTFPFFLTAPVALNILTITCSTGGSEKRLSYLKSFVVPRWNALMITCLSFLVFVIIVPTIVVKN